MVERAGNFFTTKLYWLPNEEKLIILSIFQSRDFPMGDIKEIKRESAPDLLHIHPLFTFRSEEHTSELQSRGHLVCRLLLEKKKKKRNKNTQVITKHT